jgi:hypothetical protein
MQGFVTSCDFVNLFIDCVVIFFLLLLSMKCSFVVIF